jgi:hypothetical protein
MIAFAMLLAVAGGCFCQDSAWKLLGNAGTTNANFLGTTDNRPLFFRVNNIASGRIEPGVNSNNFLGFQAGHWFGKYRNRYACFKN